MLWNHISGGDCSTAMALLFPKVPCVIALTGGDYPQALRQINQLQQKGHTIIAIASMQGGYQSYFDYLWKSNKIPFFKGCCSRGKEMHLDRFHKTIPGTSIVNIGFIKGEEGRAERLSRQDTKKRKFNFPMLSYTREQCEKIIRSNSMEPLKSRTGCWFCPKGDNPPEWAIKAIISPEGQAMRAEARHLNEELDQAVILKDGGKEE